MAKVRLAVLFGGATKDHKLSLMSAYSLLSGLHRDKYDVTPIGITKAGRWLYFPGSYDEIRDGTWEMSSDCCSAIISPDPLHAGIITIMSDGSTAFKRVDVIFSVLHGKYGECGRMQGLLKLSKIPYTDLDPETAACCTDKAVTHLMLSSAGVDVPRYAILERADMQKMDNKIAAIEKTLTYPVYVSATNCSSSIGANIVYNAAELKNAAKIAFSHHHTCIVEEDLSGRSIEVAVLGSAYEVETTLIGEVVKSREQNSAVAYTAEFVPDPDISQEQKDRIYAIATKVFRSMSLKGCVKMSFKISATRVMLRRIAVIPGYTPESALMMLMRASGYEYGEAVDRLVGLALDTDI